MRGLYAIVDVTTLSRRHLSVLEVASAIARARPAALQVRAKDLAPREILQLLRAIHSVCRESGVPLFANDRPDLAMLAGCEGVHVGQGDLPVHMVRRIAPMLRVGVSTHTLSEVERALRFLWERGGEVKKESLHQQAILLRNLARHWVKAGPSDVEYAEERCRSMIY